MKGPDAERIKNRGRLIPTPDVRRTEFLGKIPATGEVFYVTSSQIEFTHESMKVYLGKPGNLKELKIDRVTQVGVAISFDTEAGWFSFTTEEPPYLYPKINGEYPLENGLDENLKKKLDVESRRRILSDEEIEARIGKDLKEKTEMRLPRTPCDTFNEVRPRGSNQPSQGTHR